MGVLLLLIVLLSHGDTDECMKHINSWQVAMAALLSCSLQDGPTEEQGTWLTSSRRICQSQNGTSRALALNLPGDLEWDSSWCREACRAFGGLLKAGFPSVQWSLAHFKTETDYRVVRVMEQVFFKKCEGRCAFMSTHLRVHFLRWTPTYKRLLSKRFLGGKEAQLSKHVRVSTFFFFKSTWDYCSQDIGNSFNQSVVCIVWQI